MCTGYRGYNFGGSYCRKYRGVNLYLFYRCGRHVGSCITERSCNEWNILYQRNHGCWMFRYQTSCRSHQSKSDSYHYEPGSTCAPGTIDITAAAVTAGSTAGLTFTYFTDAAGTLVLGNTKCGSCEWHILY